VSELRVGIKKIREKWEYIFNSEISFLTKDYLQEKFPVKIEEDNLVINSSIIPDNTIYEYIYSLGVNQKLVYNEKILAVRLKQFDKSKFKELTDSADSIIYSEDIKIIDRPYQLCAENKSEIEADFKCITNNRQSAPISKTVNVINPENVFLEEGVKMEFVTINASEGPVYLGKNSEVMEGTVIRGSFALCEHSSIKMSSKVYPDCTIGPHSKCGGEISNVVFQGYSNKAHDGFLGNAFIGEWCNLGADTNNSNLKNNYAIVKLWDYDKNRFLSTGMQFFGTVMGDHSKTGINTMLNTGTVIGVSANVYGSGFPRNFIPSFSIGGNHGLKEYRLKEACNVAKLVMQRRGIEFDKKEEKILNHIFENSSEYRKSF
jgi:UDP-N-acetylglucosamine diphosphorylase/glucosamine-1-phosphate N-acetyltransferase